jgi:hypothetical protein
MSCEKHVERLIVHEFSEEARKEQFYTFTEFLPFPRINLPEKNK